MAKSIHLEVITPSKLFYEGDVELVIARTLAGDEGFMANHAWACKLLDTGELWIKEAGRKEYIFAAITGGYIDVKDEIIVFTDAAEWPDDIDVDRAMNEKERAEAWLRVSTENSSDSLEVAKAKLAIAKALTRMHVKEGGSRHRR